LALALKADHGELAVLETETGIAGGPEAEQRIGPVLNGKNFLSVERAHVFSFSEWSERRTFRLSGRLPGLWNRKPLQLKEIWRVHRVDCRDSQPHLMRNWGRTMAVGL
jgi:hypothetical protein